MNRKHKFNDQEILAYAKVGGTFFDDQLDRVRVPLSVARGEATVFVSNGMVTVRFARWQSDVVLTFTLDAVPAPAVLDYYCASVYKQQMEVSNA